jgi:hypothetical protein
MIPIIVWSGDARSVGEKAEWLSDQVILILPKPFDLDEFYHRLDEALAGRQDQKDGRLTA